MKREEALAELEAKYQPAIDEAAGEVDSAKERLAGLRKQLDQARIELSRYFDAVDQKVVIDEIVARGKPVDPGPKVSAVLDEVRR